MKIKMEKLRPIFRNCANSVIQVHRHDGAVVGSFSIDSTASVEKIEACLRSEMLKLKDWVNYKKGIVGHIKAGVKIEEQFVMYSVTDEAFVKKERLAESKRLEFAAIAYFVEENEMKEALAGCLKSICNLD